MERSIRFNNAGVACFEAGRKRIAWDFFKGALEIRLALERLQRQEGGADEEEEAEDNGDGFVVAAAVVDNDNDQADNVYVQRAQEHFLRLDEYLPAEQGQNNNDVDAVVENDQPMNNNENNNDDVDMGPIPPPRRRQNNNPVVDVADLARQQEHQQAATNNNNNNDMDDLFPVPFLFTHALELPAHQDENDGILLSMRRQSATIIYNLALIDHTQSRNSNQAVALYELALSLIAGDPVDMLGVALVNNMGVWCYENDDFVGARNCMGHLGSFLLSRNPFIARLELHERRGLESNVLWLSIPVARASPAA